MLPDLKKLTGATKITNQGASALQITLRDGRVESCKPRSQNGPLVVWTLKNPTSSQTVLEQSLSDTLLFKCPLNNEPPVIRIDSGRVGLLSHKSEFVSIENLMLEPLPPPGPFTLSHFEALYDLVNKVFVPTVTAVPPSPPICAGCDVDPFYCPPALV
jgi:hypothetical protein